MTDEEFTLWLYRNEPFEFEGGYLFPREIASKFIEMYGEGVTVD